MKVELNDLLDKSFVISIDDARLNFFYEQFKSAEFEKLPKPVVQGIKLKQDEWFNKRCQTSNEVKTYISIINTHKMIIAMAQALDYPFVWIFEDDVVGRIDVKDKLDNVLNDVPDDADILFLGSLKCGGFLKDCGNGIVIPGNNTKGLQSYIVFKQAYTSALEHIGKHSHIPWVRHFKKPYMTKELMFCQYNKGFSSDRAHYKTAGFIHQTYDKKYLNEHFKIFNQES